MSDENELTPAERELERTLRSLRPTPARIDPAAAAAAAGNRTAPFRSRLWQSTAAAALVAAAFWAWQTWGRRGEFAEHARNVLPATTAEAFGAEDWSASPLTFAVCRQALTRSPADLDALLDRQASESALGQFNVGGVPTVWNSEFRFVLGEM